MRNHNGSTWDELYPKTTADQVIEDALHRFLTDSERTAWNAKANGTHTHIISEITGLQTALDGKAATSHSHTLSQITDAGTAAAANTGTSSGNVPVLGGDGKLNPAVLPAIAITDTFVVASQTEMLALTAQVGDVAVRTDIKKNFILRVDGAGTLANWQELESPTDVVTSVAGKTGAVTLTSSDVGLGNVTNESKTTMFTSPALTGTPTAPTAAGGTNTTQIATTAFVQSGLSGKANTSHTHAISDTTGLQGALDAKAPLASPTFTGVPAAPTATAGTNTTQVATTAFVTTGLATKANSTHSHAVSDVTGLQGALDAKAALASPALTGTPTAPTATGGTSSTQIATTAFVANAVTAVSSSMPKITVSSTAPSTPALGDFWYEES